ncbi:MAG: excalibur calcium-binding domain-containing protein [Frankiaceae bacterium]
MNERRDRGESQPGECHPDAPRRPGPAAGLRGPAPLHAGQPGYRAALARDGDGIGCE